MAWRVQTTPHFFTGGDPFSLRMLEPPARACAVNSRRGLYPRYRGYGGFTRCEREQSSQIAVDRYGTHGGPPGRVILAQ